jgi:hypothetical protein
MKNDDKHEFRPGCSLHPQIEEPHRCCRCGEDEAHEDHLDESGEPFMEWGHIDQIRANGTLSPA